MCNVRGLPWRDVDRETGLIQVRQRADAWNNVGPFHTLRHAAASIFIQHLKWSPKRIQTVMGHSSVRMTFDPYGHLFEDIEKDRADMATIEAAIRAA